TRLVSDWSSDVCSSDLCAEMRGLEGESRRSAVRRVVELCHLEGVLGQTIDTLSKGFRHRTCLAQSLIHDPEVLILDEPTDGLDRSEERRVGKECRCRSR